MTIFNQIKKNRNHEKRTNSSFWDFNFGNAKKLKKEIRQKQKKWWRENVKILKKSGKICKVPRKWSYKILTKSHWEWTLETMNPTKKFKLTHQLTSTRWLGRMIFALDARSQRNRWLAPYSDLSDTNLFARQPLRCTHVSGTLSTEISENVICSLEFLQ